MEGDIGSVGYNELRWNRERDKVKAIGASMGTTLAADIGVGMEG